MANHEMKNLSQIDSGVATPTLQSGTIMLTSSWREVREVAMTGLQAPAGLAPASPKHAKKQK
jgi:hypothetical protein